VEKLSPPLKLRGAGGVINGFKYMHGIKKNEITDISEIDWDELIKNQRERKPEKRERGPQYWDKRATSFVDHVGKTTYPDAFLKIMEPQESWTVLDMGCGGGTLSLPLASLVREITAADFSPKMVEILNTEIGRRGIRNIKTMRLSWEDDWPQKEMGVYDVAIASRSLSVDNIHAAILKLIGAARRRVYISTVVGDGPMDRRIFDAVGRELIPAVDYIYIYNLLYQMGIHANISFIEEENCKIFDNVNAAGNYLKWMLHEMTDKEEYKLDLYLQENMVMKDGKKIFDYKKTFKWAVIWWDR
jgi:SAM-dependent methyltransferase